MTPTHKDADLTHMIDTDLTRAALAIATEAHKGQMRKDKKTPYIEHPKAVAELAVDLFRRRHHIVDTRVSELVYVIGVLHDVIEDCPHAFGAERDLIDEGLMKRAYLTPRERDVVVHSLTVLNKTQYHNYLKFTCAAKGDWLASFVKRADLRHNLSDLKPGSLRDKYELALYILET